MFLVRDVFQCKPGRAKDLVKSFKDSFAGMQKPEGMKSFRICTDIVYNYWTVVFEVEVENLEIYTGMLQGGNSSNSGSQNRPAQGYMEFVKGGHREIFKIEETM